MPLSPGSQLGPYGIVGAIGAGGMGEVYRGRDGNLGRDVAIKVLPPAMAGDTERLARFKREAQVLASLNHPNIAHVYGFEAATLGDGSTAHFLAMELVGGEDLAERLKRGAVPVDEALALARQIVDGLEEAHDHGIIHRDLKPANIRVTPDGKVKVLDFGLAKAFSDDGTSGASPEISNSPTMSRHMTEAGMIMGTAAYMSPEQARGKEVDRRSDNWAFGVVLYEMLTGERLFSGETVSDVLAAVLTRDPAWTALPSQTPPGVRRLLRRCLERNPRKRLNHIADARFDLDEGDLSSGEVPPPGDAGEGSTSRDKRRLRVALAGTAVALVGMAVGGLAVRGLTDPSDPRAPIRVALELPEPADVVHQASGLAVSPDGSRVVFPHSRNGERTLFVRSLDQLEAKLIPGTENGAAPFMSPDGQSMGFFTIGRASGEANTLRTIRFDGGAPMTLASVDASLAFGFTYGGQWTSDGQILFSSGPVIQRVAASGGSPIPLTALDLQAGELRHAQPWMLPGGRALLYVATLNGGRQKLMAKKLDVEKSLLLVEGAGMARYLKTGHLLFERDGALYAVAFDPNRLSLSGEPVRVLDRLQVAVFGGYRRAQLDLSESGALAYLSERDTGASRQVVFVDRGGRATPAFEETGAFLVPRLSPDGGRLAYASVDPKSGQRNIWVRDLDRGTRTRLTLGTGSATDPVWSPDGRTLTFTASQDDGSMNLASADASGSQEPVRLSDSTSRARAPFARFWLPDGSGIVFQSIGDSNDIGIFRSGSTTEEMLLARPYNELEPSLSPDGRFLAYVSDESGRREVYVRPLGSASGRLQVSNEGGEQPVWSPRGGELFYRRGIQMIAASVSSAGELRMGASTVLFEGRYENDSFGDDATNYDVTKDGRRFVMIRRSGTAPAGQQLNVVLNWFSEVRRLTGSTK